MCFATKQWKTVPSDAAVPFGDLPSSFFNEPVLRMAVALET
jgi:hypothetical protein